MQGIDESDGDPAHWLPHGEDLLTEARQLRGDTVTTTNPVRGGEETRTFENMLVFYFLRERITANQYHAGQRFFALWRNSCLRTRFVTMRYGEQGGSFDADGVALMPREYLDACAAVRGEKELRAVRQVCIDSKKAGKRGGMLYLKSGLDDLAIYFKLDRR
ncbi:MAG: hypothetical protein K8U57_36170 [Planctomycetes bacterium]|nr:hypothetical protein [Planctomycetota bacterium]